mgnify:CR=1 FL=1
MIIIPAPYFKKKVSKLPKYIKVKLASRIRLFWDNPKNPILNNHRLHGKYDGYRSINITGDYRVIYEEVGNNTIRLIDIGTHSELY